MKIGVMVESFRLGLAGGLKAAAELGADGVQISTTSGDMHPAKLKGRARTDLRRQVADLHLEISALCGDFGGHGFQVASENKARIEDSKRVMDLALELGCRVVTTHIGVVPADRAHPRYAVLARACETLGAFGEKVGAVFAIETGPEPAVVLRAFLDDLGIPRGLGVNFDPANLAMVIAEDIPAAVAALGPRIVHTHAKDGIHLKDFDPEQLYNPAPGATFAWNEHIREVPLGQGSVNFDTYLPALRQAGFDGFLTIEREVGDHPMADIRLAVEFLKPRLTA
jgi:sugar phosphate isomerase/epimerase